MRGDGAGGRLELEDLVVGDDLADGADRGDRERRAVLLANRIPRRLGAPTQTARPAMKKARAEELGVGEGERPRPRTRTPAVGPGLSARERARSTFCAFARSRRAPLRRAAARVCRGARPPRCRPPRRRPPRRRQRRPGGAGAGAGAERRRGAAAAARAESDGFHSVGEDGSSSMSARTLGSMSEGGSRRSGPRLLARAPHLHGHRLRLLLDVGGRSSSAQSRKAGALARDGGAPDGGAPDVRRVSTGARLREEEDGEMHVLDGITPSLPPRLRSLCDRCEWRGVNDA